MNTRTYPIPQDVEVLRLNANGLYEHCLERWNRLAELHAVMERSTPLGAVFELTRVLPTDTSEETELRADEDIAIYDPDFKLHFFRLVSGSLPGADVLKSLALVKVPA